MTIICVACGLEHKRENRLDKNGVEYTMCPRCGCGGFIKRN